MLGDGRAAGSTRHPSNPLNTAPLLRAMVVNMDVWATSGTIPPDSRTPSQSEETAVPADVAASNFPEVPTVEHPNNPSRLFVQDHGSEYEDKGIISNEPPVIDTNREYRVLIPQVGRDGNEIPGIRTPDIEVPLATYAGWNYRPDGSSPNGFAGVTGSYLPLAKTESERRESGDSRLSIEDLYRSKAHYVRLVALASQRLVDQKLLLDEDADRYIEQAINRSIFDS